MFKKNKWQVIKQAVSKELADFVFEYFMLRREAVGFLYRNKIVSQNPMLGVFGDDQCSNVYCHYSDHAMETLLTKVLPIMKKETGLNLVPTYSYARVYEKGSILKKHKDRPSCEISTTLNLGGDPWPIYLEPNPAVGTYIRETDEYVPGSSEGIKIDLDPGDMLVYSGHDLEHWREEFTGNICGQVFLHYNHIDGPYAEQNKFDRRPLLGLPAAIYEKV